MDGDTLSGGGRTMAWDSQNRMVSCVNGTTSSAFTYGADGLRRSLTTGGTTTDYAYDGQSMAREMQVNASTGSLVSTATYFAGPSGPEYRRDDTQTESDGQGHTFGKTRWYVYDGLGSVLGEVDPLGDLTCANEYDVYGNIRGRAGTATTEQGFVGQLGHLSDASDGLVYMRARYMDPASGRFVSEDPKKSGTNWFTYADNSPQNKVDASGEDSEWANGFCALGWAFVYTTIIASVFSMWSADDPGVAEDASKCASAALYLSITACACFMIAGQGTSFSGDLTMNIEKICEGALLSCIAQMVGGVTIGAKTNLPGVAVALGAALGYGLECTAELATDEMD
jgi:RHS repeat-associated protein